MKLEWYPGHIAKAKKTIESNLKLVDLILEVRDARIPESSRPQAIENIIGEKLRIILLNKKDLASEEITKEWESYFEELGLNVVSFSKDEKEDVNKIFNLIREQAKNKLQDKYRDRAVRVMVTGIPNVGKSTVLNQVIQKKGAKTGAAPGITRGKQWHKIKNKIYIMDTPGVLLPHNDDIEVGYKLVACEALDINLFPLEEVCKWLFEKLSQLAPGKIKERYKLETIPGFNEFIEEVGKKRGALVKGGEVHLEKVFSIFIKDFNSGKLGRISLEEI